MNFFYGVVLIFLLTFHYEVKGQQNPVFGIFPTIDNSGQIGKKFTYNTYSFVAIKPYNNNNKCTRESPYFAYAELGTGYQLTPTLNLSVGYVFENQEPYTFQTRYENRLFQQLTHKKDLGKFTLKNRLRFEERFFSYLYSSNKDFSHRARYLIGGKYQITEKYYVMGYSESFFHTTGWNQFKFDENWSALQLGIKLNQNNALELGYLYIGWDLNHENSSWLHQHYLQTTWVNTLNFKKSSIEKKS